MICPKCKHSWDYKGKSTCYLTCPHCYNKIRAPRPSTQQEQIPTTQQEQIPTTQQELLPTPKSIIDAKQKVAKHTNDFIDTYIRLYFSEKGGCISGILRDFLCDACGADFMAFPFARYCPICGSLNPRQLTQEEAKKMDDDDKARINFYTNWADGELKAIKKAEREAAKQKAREERKAAQKAATESAKKTSKDADITYDRYEKINKLTEDQVHRIRNLYFTNEDDYVEIIEKEFGVSDEDAFDFAHVLVVNDLRDLYNDGTPIEDIAERLEIPEHKQDVIELVQCLVYEKYLKPRK